MDKYKELRGQCEGDDWYYAKQVRALLAERDALLEAAMRTREIVAEAATTGFNYKDGDWPERLFSNQAALSRAIEAAKRQEGV